MEGRSAKAFEALNDINDDTTVTVVRDGEVTLVSQRDITIGDVLQISTGDEAARPAARLSNDADESARRAESPPTPYSPTGNRTNMLYSGWLQTSRRPVAIAWSPCVVVSVRRSARLRAATPCRRSRLAGLIQAAQRPGETSGAASFGTIPGIHHLHNADVPPTPAVVSWRYRRYHQMSSRTRWSRRRWRATSAASACSLSDKNRHVDQNRAIGHFLYAEAGRKPGIGTRSAGDTACFGTADVLLSAPPAGAILRHRPTPPNAPDKPRAKARYRTKRRATVYVSVTRRANMMWCVTSRGHGNPEKDNYNAPSTACAARAGGSRVGRDCGARLSPTAIFR